MDVALISVDCIEESSTLSKNIFDVLLGGCFQLQTWYSNDPFVLCQLGSSMMSQEHLIEIGDDRSKTLGFI